MANILIVWELGTGLGHIAKLLPLAARLSRQGHTVHLALRDLAVTANLPQGQYELWPAPFKTSRPRTLVREPRTYADILFNCGFGQASELMALEQAWRSIFKGTGADLVIAEHSPTAVLAARCSGVPVIQVGTGFSCPGAEAPLRDLRPWLRKPLDVSHRAEALVLSHANQALSRAGRAPLRQLSQLWREVAATCLMTAPTLDPYAPRAAAEYFGAVPWLTGKPPVWPEGPGKRVFAYLKSFPALPHLLALLAEMKTPTLVVCDGIDAAIQRRFKRSTLSFENEPLAIAPALAACDLAICNANHGTTYAILQAGKPALYLPLHLEQMLSGFAVQRRGAGRMASVRRPEQVSLRLLEVMQNEEFAAAARQQSPSLARYQPELELERMVRVVESSLASRAR